MLRDVQHALAREYGHEGWVALKQAIETLPAESAASTWRTRTAEEYERLANDLVLVHDSHLEANGLMTDPVLARIAELDHVTALTLGGSRQLTDDGLLHLARMPQLQTLNLSEYPGGRLTDRGLEALRHLPNLRTFEMTWQRGMTDAGIANLGFCDQLERVNLMGSPTGDGAIDVLQRKPKLGHFSSGRLVTDAGLRLLHNFPMLRRKRGTAPFCALR